jgi:hypothetical protein
MSEQPSPFPQTPPDFPRLATQPAKKSYRWLIIGLAGLLVLTCLCVAGVAVILIRNIAAVPEDIQAIERQIDQFMQFGEKHDAESAFALFSTRGQQNMPLADIQKLFGRTNSDLFREYTGLTTSHYGFHTSTEGDQDSDGGLPSGSFVTLEGELEYEGDMRGTFDATLEQVDGQWKLYNIRIGAPEKFRHNDNG